MELIQNLMPTNQPQITGDIQDSAQALLPNLQNKNGNGNGNKQGPLAPPDVPTNTFTKKLKSFKDINVISFSGNVKVIISFKWIQHAMKISEKMGANTDVEHREILYQILTGTTFQ